MPRILLFKDPEPEEINGFKDITEAVNFLDIIIQCDGQSINNKEHFCFTHRTIDHMRSEVLNIAMEEPKWDALSARHAPGEELFGI